MTVRTLQEGVRAMQRTLALGLTVLVACAGCASYTPTSVPIPQAGAMPAWRTEGAVAVGADPYTQLERQEAVFGGDLNKEGVIPIQVFLQNQGDRRLLVRPSDMVLVLPDGSQMNPAGATATAAKLESSGGVIASTIAFGIVGYLVAASAADKARTARLEDYRRKELQDTKLEKNASIHGFVYFIPPPGTPAFTESTLVVRVVDSEELTSLVVHLPLHGVEFKGAPAKAEQ